MQTIQRTAFRLCGLTLCLLIIFQISPSPAAALTPPPPPSLAFEIAKAQEVVIAECIDAKTDPNVIQINGGIQITYYTFRVLESWRGKRTDNVVLSYPHPVSAPMITSAVKEADQTRKKALLFIQSPGMTDGKPDPAKPVQYFYTYGLHWLEKPDDPQRQACFAILKQVVQIYKEPPDTKSGWFDVAVNPETVKLLIDTIAMAKTEDERLYATGLLCSFGSNEQIGPKILPLLEDRNPKIQWWAADYVMRTKCGTGTEPLRRFYDAQPAGAIKDRIGAYLAEWRVQKAVDSLPNETRSAFHAALKSTDQTANGSNVIVYFVIDADGHWSQPQPAVGFGDNALRSMVADDLQEWLEKNIDTIALEQKPLRLQMAVDLHPLYPTVTWQRLR